MAGQIKQMVRKLMFSAGIDITKNQQYDRQTLAIIKSVMKPDSGSIDIGCHKGEVLDELIKAAPNGNHYGFEPIPALYRTLQSKYKGQSKVSILPYALSNSSGQTSFNWVKNAPAYSGLEKRSYDVKDPDIESIDVELARLDDIGKDFAPISLIKIDVEGGEMNVLKGAKHFIEKHQPVVIFEFGLGAADHYNVTPEMIHGYFHDLRYGIYTLKGFLDKASALTLEVLGKTFKDNSEYYFAAAPVVE